MRTDPLDTARKALTDSVLGMPGVVGTAVGQWGDRSCLMVLLEKDDPAVKARLPRSVQGFDVITKVTGAFRPF
ncbi:MAG: hypothetical protein R3E98_05005 [Gemmatimonadota bacterium]|nr:hypothetical protein [Gemmatimonadota bacterium]